MQSGRTLLHVIMSAIASLRDVRFVYVHDIVQVVEGLIEAGADVNVVDKVSYREAPYYIN